MHNSILEREVKRTNWLRPPPCEVHAGIQKLFQGVQAPRLENSLDSVVLFCFGIFSPQLILQFTEGVQWFYYREDYPFPRIQRGPTFSRGGGSNIFQGGGPNDNFYRNPYNLWFDISPIYPSGFAHEMHKALLSTNHKLWSVIWP